MSTSSDQRWVQGVFSRWTWRLPKCQCLISIFSWLIRLIGTCFQAVCRLGRVSTPILPTVNPRSQSPKRRCARWWNWCRKCKCQCTSPTCRKYRRWKKDWRKLPSMCFRRMRNLTWPVWEPDQNSLFTRVIKASRLDGFKMSLKEGMHFAARIMYVVTYKIFTGIAIYLIFVSSVKIRTHPMIYKDVGKVAMENIPFAGIDVCPSQLFPQELLIAAKWLYKEAKSFGYAIDAFGAKWSLKQAAKLYYYVCKKCNAAKSHSRFAGFSTSYLFPDSNLLLKDQKQITLRDTFKDADYKKILGLVDQYKGTVDCSKILQACRWGPAGMRNCSELFEIENTETGDCCRLKRISFESLETAKAEASERRWNIDEYSFTKKSENGNKQKLKDTPLFQKVAGSEFGLTFVLTMETEDMACPINEGAAYMVYVHSPLDSPNAKTNGIPIAPNHEVYIKLNAEVTIPDKDIFDVPTESRQCYSQNEGNFLNANDYTEGNCRIECRHSLYQSRCKCQPFGTTMEKNETFCGPQHEECEKKLEAELHSHGYAQMCMNLSRPMKCYHSCTEVVYTTVVSSTPYFGEPAFLDELKLKKGQYASTVRIFFDSDTFAARQMQQQYDFWEYVGIVGGLLGMLIGFDFMTLVHLTYAFGIWMKGLWLKRKKSRVAQAIFNMTNHVDLVKALSGRTPIIPTRSAGLSTANLGEPPTWPGQMTRLEARLKSVFVIQKGAETQPIPFDDPLEPDPIDPVDIIIPTRQKIRNALFEHMPKTVAFKNIFVIPKRVAPADLIDNIELFDIEDAETTEMELVGPAEVHEPTDIDNIAPVDPSQIAPLEPSDISEVVDSTITEPTDPVYITPTDQIDVEPVDTIDVETLCPTDI